MYFPLEKADLHCYVNLPEGIHLSYFIVLFFSIWGFFFSHAHGSWESMIIGGRLATLLGYNNPRSLTVRRWKATSYHPKKERIIFQPSFSRGELFNFQGVPPGIPLFPTTRRGLRSPCARSPCGRFHLRHRAVKCHQFLDFFQISRQLW